MSFPISNYIEHIRPLPRASSVTTFICLVGIIERLGMLSEVLEMADAHGENLHCLGALAKLVESQIIEMERILGSLCPNMDELSIQE